MASDAIDEGPITESLLGLARILLAGQSADSTLGSVAKLARDSIPNCDSASVTVMQDGRPGTSVSTSELARAIDDHQYGSGEGPCLDAVRGRVTVRCDSFADDQRWPQLAPAAINLGARSSLSLPLIARDDAVGALNLYSVRRSGFVESEKVGEVFATHAAITLANAAALQRATELAAQLSVALERRDVIGQAKGILMAQSRLSSEEAFDVLRRASQRSNRKLHDIARDMVRRRSEESSR